MPLREALMRKVEEVTFYGAVSEYEHPQPTRGFAQMALQSVTQILHATKCRTTPNPSFHSCRLVSSDLHPSLRACRMHPRNLSRRPSRLQSSHHPPSEEKVETIVSSFEEEIFPRDFNESAAVAKSEPEVVDGFYYDELREAVATLKKRVQAGISWSFFTDTTEEEGVPAESADKEVSKEEVDGNVAPTPPNSAKSRNSGKAVRVKIPIESNAPPASILRPYLAPDDPETTKVKLRPLPLPMPHLSHPLGLPRASLRSRLGLVPSKQSVAQVLASDDLALEIRALSRKARVSDVLDKYVSNLRKGSLAKTVRELGRMQLTERVLEVLSWLQEHPRLWPDHTTLSTVIQVMVEAGEIEVAIKMQKNLGEKSARVAKTLCFELAKIGMLAEAAEVLNYMKRLGWKIDGAVHAKVIQWACNTGGRHIVERLLAGTDLVELNLKTQDYVTIMDSCSKLGLPEGLRRVYLQFKASEVQPDTTAYTVLMSALNREGIYQESMALFDEIEREGYKPDILAYQVMLDTCAKVGDLERAVKTFEAMRNAGFEPTHQIYNAVVQLHFKLGLKLTAKHIMDEMQSKGFPPSAETFSLLANSSSI